MSGPQPVRAVLALPEPRHGQPTQISAIEQKAQRKRGMFNLKYNIKLYIFYESQTFPNSSLPQFPLCISCMQTTL
jgi:hypothetical protein